MARLFGTDGVRGVANEKITAELAVDLSVAAAHVLGKFGAFDAGRPNAIVARDPRASGDFLSAAVCAGLASAGVDVADAGVIPTPALAYLVKSTNADLGVMISASHNPMADNGIKFFARGGTKLPDEVEDEIEARLGEKWDRPLGPEVGRISAYQNGTERYVGHLVSTIPSQLDGLSVVVDCAHGAAYQAGPQALRAAGARVHVIGAEPDGNNINDGYGSTHLDKLQAAVVEHGADAGIAYDGDSDRCLAVDQNGELIDGDQIMGILAKSLKARGELRENTLVATIMSNLGLRLAMRDEGINVISAAVGDRYVLEEMTRGGFTLGGEQSGHVVLSNYATTGDGILTSLQLLSRMVETGQSLSKLGADITKLPQSMVNVAGVDKARAGIDHEVLDAVQSAEEELGEGGRVVLRPSGTEALVRVMVEAGTEEVADRLAQNLAEVVRARLSIR